MSQTPVLDQPVVEQLARCMYTVFHTAVAPLMKLPAIYGIVIPNDASFGTADAEAMAPDPFVVFDPFANTTAPAFARLQLDEELDVVMVAITGDVQDVLRELTLPTYAAGMVVASEVMLAGVSNASSGEAEVVTGCLVTAATHNHTYAVAGIPERDVFGTIGAEHPDVQSIRAVVNKTCCRIS